MTEPIVIELEYIPPAEVRGNSRAHWAMKAQKAKELSLSGWVRRFNEPGLDGQVRITFAFYHWRKIDLDNLAIGMKSFVDGLIRGGLMLDDDPDHVVYGAHTFTKCPKGESRTIVTIEELDTPQES